MCTYTGCGSRSTFTVVSCHEATPPPRTHHSCRQNRPSDSHVDACRLHSSTSVQRTVLHVASAAHLRVYLERSKAKAPPPPDQPWRQRWGGPTQPCYEASVSAFAFTCLAQHVGPVLDRRRRFRRAPPPERRPRPAYSRSFVCVAVHYSCMGPLDFITPSTFIPRRVDKDPSPTRRQRST